MTPNPEGQGKRLIGAERYRFARICIETAGTWRDKRAAVIAAGYDEALATEGRIKAALRDWPRLRAKWGAPDPLPAPRPDAASAKRAECAAQRGAQRAAFRVTRSGKRPQNGRIGRMAVFDIETTDLAAVGRQGFLVCCSILPIDDSDPYTLSLAFGENGGDDTRLLSDVLEELARYDFLIGHNITAFDLNWLNTRRAFQGLPAMRRWYVFDTYQVAKSLALRVTRKSLAFLCDAFGIECVKTSIYPAAWNDVRSPLEREFRGALDDIIYHCEQDVHANRLLFERLWGESFGLNTPPLKLYKMGDLPQYAVLG